MLHDIGELVEIVRRRHGHQFQIGTKVRIIQVNQRDYLVRDSSGESWYVTDEEIAATGC